VEKNKTTTDTVYTHTCTCVHVSCASWELRILYNSCFLLVHFI